MEKQPYVTIAVITRNRADSLRRTLHGIQNLNYVNYEVIVVDNASTDMTKSVIEEFNFNYVFSPRKYGFAKTRQLAVDAAKGEFILWCDDDAVPVVNWVQYYVDRFRSDENIGLIAGKVVNHGFSPEMKFKGIQIFGPNGVLLRVENPLEAMIYSNLNMAQRISVMRSIRGYDPFFIGSYEEVDLNLMIRSVGKKVVYEEKALVDHYHSEVSFKKGRLFYGSQMMRLYLYFKHHEVIGNQEFYKIEFNYLINDLWKSLRICLSGIKRLNSNYFLVGVIEVSNSLSSRIMIPWIKYKANKFK